jgi:uncharacterized coiled-coil protein SlyX
MTIMRLERAVLVSIGALAGAALFGLVHAVLPARATAAQASAAVQASSPPTVSTEGAELRARVERLEAKAADQAHAMSDVGYQFANLWFAGEKENWPLARFCLDETRSHLRWAVRIIPVRKTPAGEDLELKGILDALETSVLAELGKTIEARERVKFETAYRHTLEGCYSCHKAAGKPFIRPRVPETPPAPILNFDPAAAWPR